MATLYFGVATSIAFLPKLSFADINARMQSMYLSKIEETSSTNSSFVSVTMKSHTSSAMLAMLVESSIKGENFFSTNVINFNPFDRRLLILVSRPNKKQLEYNSPWHQLTILVTSCNTSTAALASSKHKGHIVCSRIRESSVIVLMKIQYHITKVHVIIHANSLLGCSKECLQKKYLSYTNNIINYFFAAFKMFNMIFLRNFH